MFWKAVCDNLGTIIGVIGSLLGAIIGWWLNNISRRGKLTIYVENGINGEFVTEEELPSTSLEKSRYFNYKFKIEIYNSSGDTKIMRDIKIVFCNDSNELFATIPYDKSRMIRGNGPTINKPVELFNIQPKTAIKIDLYGFVCSDNLNEVIQTTSVYLTYKDEQNKPKKMLIESFDYHNYEFYQGEE